MTPPYASVVARRCPLTRGLRLGGLSHEPCGVGSPLPSSSDRKGADIASGVPLGAAPDRRADRLHIRLLRLDLAILDHSMPTRQLIATNGGSGMHCNWMRFRSRLPV